MNPIKDIRDFPYRDGHLSAEEKINQALRWVGKQEPIAVPVVLTRWKVDCSMDCPTMSTNGRELKYNVDFVDRISLNAAKAIVLHEVGHVLSQHQHRRGERDPKGFNIAADLALNCLLCRGYRAAYNNDAKALHDELIAPGGVASGCFVGFGQFASLPSNQDAEEYYELLKQEAAKQPQPQPQPQPGDDDQGDKQDGQGDKQEDQGDKQEDQGDKQEDQGDKQEDQGDKQDGQGGRFISLDEALDLAARAAEASLPPKPLPPPSLFDVFQGSSVGDVEDAPEPEDQRADEQAVILETLLNHEAIDNYSPLGLGKILSGIKEKLIGDIEAACDVNWRTVLEEFLRSVHNGALTYNKINRRMHSIAQAGGYILPTRAGRGKTNGAVLVDTSGSMGDTDCEQALAHTGQVLSLFPSSTVNLIQCDTKVRCSDEYSGSDFPPKDWKGWSGRGGTDLGPGFRFIKEHQNDFDWCIVVTDAEFYRVGLTDPRVPVLWVITRPGAWADVPLPFGKVVTIHAK